MALGASKREIEENYSYDELVTMLDIHAYAHADEKERARYDDWPARYKVLNGLPVTRDEAKRVSLFR